MVVVVVLLVLSTMWAHLRITPLCGQLIGQEPRRKFLL